MAEQIEKKPNIVRNAIPDQNKQGANSLTIQEWNTTINVLKRQANLNTSYLERLHRALFFNWDNNTIGTIEIAEAFKKFFSQTWYFEAYDPTTEGRSGDMWLNTTSMDIFLRDESWGLQGNITGAKGDKGVSLSIQGAWNPLVSYYNNDDRQDIVTYGGDTYYCKVTIIGAVGNLDPTLDTTTWGIFTKQGASFRHRGEWSSAVLYYSDDDHIDVVSYLGDLYYAKESILETGGPNPVIDVVRWGIYTEKGVSFRACGAWDTNVSYFNDSSYIDVVSYNGKMWACKLTIDSAGNPAPSADPVHWELYLDNAIVPAFDTTTTAIDYTIEDNCDKTFDNTGIVSVTIRIPPTVSHGFIAGVNFRSGATPSMVAFINNADFPLKLIKYGLVVPNYTPAASRTVGLLFYCDGINLNCIIHEVA